MTLLGLALLLATQPATVKGPCIEISGPEVSVGDLSPYIPGLNHASPGRAVAPSPRPGVQRTLIRKELARLVGISVDHPGLPAELCIVRAAMPLTEVQLMEALSQAWKQAGGVPPDEVTILDYPKIGLPAGEIHLTVPSASALSVADCERPQAFRGMLRYDRTQSLPVWVIAKVQSTQNILSYANDLQPGHVLEAGDVLVRVRSCVGPVQGAVRTVEGAVGKRLKMAAAAGEAVLTRHFTQDREVNRGDPVTVNIGGAPNVSVSAVAVTGGRLGEKVILQNPVGKSRFQAVVTGRRLAAAEGEKVHAVQN